MTKTKNYEQLRSRLRTTPESRILGEQYDRAIRDALALGKLQESWGDAQEGQEPDHTTSPRGNAATTSIELQDNPYLSALYDYITALGGQLEITAVFPEQRVSLVVPRGEQAESAEDSEQKVPVNG